MFHTSTEQSPSVDLHLLTWSKCDKSSTLSDRNANSGWQEVSKLNLLTKHSISMKTMVTQLVYSAEMMTIKDWRIQYKQYILHDQYKTSTSVFGNSPISTHADPTYTRRTIFHERRISSVKFTSAHVYTNVYIGVGVMRSPIHPILGFWGSKVPQNGTFPAWDADEPLCKIWRR